MRDKDCLHIHHLIIYSLKSVTPEFCTDLLVGEQVTSCSLYELPENRNKESIFRIDWAALFFVVDGRQFMNTYVECLSRRLIVQQ